MIETLFYNLMVGFYILTHEARRDLISIFNIKCQNACVTKLFYEKACKGVVGLFECQKFQGPQI